MKTAQWQWFGLGLALGCVLGYGAGLLGRLLAWPLWFQQWGNRRIDLCEAD